jgi:hypothetical protein
LDDAEEIDYDLKLNNYVRTHQEIWNFIKKIQDEKKSSSFKIYKFILDTNCNFAEVFQGIKIKYPGIFNELRTKICVRVRDLITKTM